MRLDQVLNEVEIGQYVRAVSGPCEGTICAMATGGVLVKVTADRLEVFDPGNGEWVYGRSDWIVTKINAEPVP